MKTNLSETGLPALHIRWAHWSQRKLRLTHSELSLKLYRNDSEFLIHVANCSDEIFPALRDYFDKHVRPVTCRIRLSQEVPQGSEAMEEPNDYEAELWLSGEPLTADGLNNTLFLLDSVLPEGQVDYDHTRNSWVFRSSVLVTPEEKNRIEKALTKLGIGDPVEVIKVTPQVEAKPASYVIPKLQGNLFLTNSRHLKNTHDSIRYLVEQDEDVWRNFLSRRAKQEILQPDQDNMQHFACLYDVERCGDSRLSELLTIYDRIDILPPESGAMDWCVKHQISLSDLQELVRLRRIRLILPYSIDRYQSSLIESVAEVDPSSLVLSRALAMKTIVRGQTKEPLLYAPLSSSQRAALLSAMSQFVFDERYRNLLNCYGELFSMQHHQFMMRGALGSYGFGVGAYLGEVFFKLNNQDARLELMTCGAGVEWALGLGASYIPRNYGDYDETINSNIIASYLGRTKLRQSDPVANRIHIVSDGLLAVSDVPPLEVAKNFHSLPAMRFRNLARKLMEGMTDESDLRAVIDQLNVDVRMFEGRVERLSSWKLGSLITEGIATATQDSLGMGVATSAVSSWLGELLGQHIPAKILNEITDVKHMLLGLVVGPSLDAVVVSRSKKAVTKI